MSTRLVRNDPHLAIPVRRGYFSGGAHLADGSNGLDAIVRGLAIDHARMKIEVSAVSDPTVSLTGVDGRALAFMTIPTDDFDASSSGGFTAASWDGVTEELQDTMSAIAEYLNDPAGRLGLRNLNWASGDFTAGTIPNVSATTSAGSGATAANRESVTASMNAVRNGVATLARSVNQVAAALGFTRVTDGSGGSPFDGYEIADVPATSNSTATAVGSDAVSKTVADAFILAAKNNLFTLCQAIRRMMGTVSTTPTLLNNTGSSAAAKYADLTIPAVFDTGGAGTAARKSSFDSKLLIIADNFAELLDYTNDISERMGLDRLENFTGGSPNSGLDVNDLGSVTSTDGDTSGDECVDGATGHARLVTVKDNLYKLAVRVNQLAEFFGERVLSNEITPSETFTNVEELSFGAVATATAAGNNGDSTLPAVGVNTFLTAVEVAMATAIATLNTFRGASVPTVSLHVVAAD